jgi:uncharacterized protein (TIGR02646 family)
MRQITKGKEPQVLKEYRSVEGATYNGFQTKIRMDKLRTSLVAEQGAICCYCMQRIRPVVDFMKVEHWLCQDDHEDEALNYKNMLGACMGNQGHDEEEEHCDTSKKNKSLARNPANPDHHVEQYIRYLPDGRIQANDPIFNDQLSDVLNLNLEYLKKNREAVLDGFIYSLPKIGPLKKSELKRMIKEWSGADGRARLHPFCGVVVYWLRKRLARA